MKGEAVWINGYCDNSPARDCELPGFFVYSFNKCNIVELPISSDILYFGHITLGKTTKAYNQHVKWAPSIM